MTFLFSCFSCIYELIKTIWNEEKIPTDWKKGIITSIWKGKGDRELLQNHRGITVSFTIGNILDEVIDRRINMAVKFTQAQGGGIKGSSTCDHIFILWSLVNIALKQQVRIHESTVACDWAGAVMPENHEKNEILDILDIF